MSVPHWSFPFTGDPAVGISLGLSEGVVLVSKLPAHLPQGLLKLGSLGDELLPPCREFSRLKQGNLWPGRTTLCFPCQVTAEMRPTH